MERIVVTGIGITSCLGFEKEHFFSNLTHGVNGVCDLDLFETTFFRTKKACQIQHIEQLPFYESSKDRISNLVYSAASQAIQDSGVNDCEDFMFNTSVILGSTIGTVESLDKHFINFNRDETSYNQKYLPDISWDSIGNCITIPYNIKKTPIILSTVCASSSHAIALGALSIKTGRSTVAIVGGVESLNSFLYAGFDTLRSLSQNGICSPFSKNRNGLIMGEGAGVVVLESESNAKKRGATIYASLEGYGISCDAYNIAVPDPNGVGVAIAMTNALNNANMSPKEVDYINAHGTGTRPNDLMETNAIKSVFKDHAYELDISSIKSMIGHTMGAAGVIEAIATILTLKNGIIPPTINYSEKDNECDLNYTPNIAKQTKVKIALSSSSGFGGNNSALIFKRYN